MRCTLVKVVVAARRRRVDSLDAYARQVLLRTFLEENRMLWRRREKSWPDPVEVSVVDGDGAAKLTVLAALVALPPRQRAAEAAASGSAGPPEPGRPVTDLLEFSRRSPCSRCQ